MTVGEITGIIGACATVVTVFLVPIARAIKSHQKEKAKEKEKQRKRDEKLDAIYDKMSTIDSNQQELNNIKAQFDHFLVDYDEFTTQNLKYMINDAFFGYENIHEIPIDVLTNACECCEIYVNKRHKNHEIRHR